MATRVVDGASIARSGVAFGVIGLGAGTTIDFAWLGWAAGNACGVAARNACDVATGNAGVLAGVAGENHPEPVAAGHRKQLGHVIQSHGSGFIQDNDRTA